MSGGGAAEAERSPLVVAHGSQKVQAGTSLSPTSAPQSWHWPGDEQRVEQLVVVVVIDLSGTTVHALVLLDQRLAVI
jgi:hypothetical protein